MNDDIKIQTARIKKIDQKTDPSKILSLSAGEKQSDKNLSSSNKLDKHSCKEKQNMGQKVKIISDEKQTGCQNDDLHSNVSKQINSDDSRVYENWSPRLPSLENICQNVDGLTLADVSDSKDSNLYDRPGSREKYDANREELLDKMKEKMKVLIDHQFNVDYKIVMNNVRGTEIESRFSCHASAAEMEKFRLFVEEFDSVHCLIRYLV